MTVNGRTIPLNALPRIVKTVRNQPAELGGDPSIGSPSRWDASERVSACERMRTARHSCDDDPSESSCSVVADGEVACHPGDERYTGVGDGGGTTMTAGADRRRRGRNPDSHHRPDLGWAVRFLPNHCYLFSPRFVPDSFPIRSRFVSSFGSDALSWLSAPVWRSLVPPFYSLL